MISKNKYLFAGLFVLLTVSVKANPDQVVCVQLDPLKKVLKEQIFFVENNEVFAAAKGETVTYQFVIQSQQAIKNLRMEAGNLTNGNSSIPVRIKAFVGYVHAGRSTPTYSKDRLIAASGLFPDPLLEIETIDVQSLSNQPVWFTYPVPHDARPGEYTADITFSGEIDGKPFNIHKQVKARIYDVALTGQTLWVTNWFSLAPDRLRLMNDNEPVEPYSARYWELIKAIARKMRENGQNVYMISPVHLCQYKIKGEKYDFDFTHFDKMVDLFIREGNMKRIEGGHLGERLSHWSSPFGVTVPVMRGSKIEFECKPLENDTAKAFFTQFIPALFNHLKGKKWDAIYMQHIADEPIESNTQSYIAIANEVKRMVPEVEIIEANHSKEVQNTIKIWVPQLNYYHSDYDFYTRQQNKGDEVWFYTCLAPQGNYANRFLEQPLIQTRILHWINYRFGATGYLHWGLNYWNENPYGETTSVNTESGNTLPAGDSWITYPANGKLYGSIRLEAMRDGIADYELLKLYEKNDPAAAKEIARTLVYQFDLYDNNIAAFRARRIELLEKLSRNNSR
ncbi:MAG: DUF4091 domain-containing protein [Tannerellaceae bacterium]|jgi:hypothetical protein|nr:DUF4091 domain-containing protein [Tannerellaceae bacterium]